MGTFKDLTVYKKSFSLAIDLHKVSGKFPKEEMFGMVSQIKRSSKSVTATIAEGYRKRMYEAYFISKISDADMENTETQVWLEFAVALNYIDDKSYNEFIERSDEVGKLLYHMINNPKKYIGNIEQKKK
jgi:four helix bundle protein